MGKGRAGRKKTTKAPAPIKKPSGVQSNQKQTEQEEEIEESGAEDAGGADVNDAGAGEGNGQGAGETQGGGETNEGDETKGGDEIKEGGEVKEGGEETQTTDAHTIAAEGGETREGGEQKETGEQTRTIDAHHEIPTGDQTSGPPGEGGDGETVVDGSHEAEPKAAGLGEGKDKDESKANQHSVDVGDKDGVSIPNEAGAVEVAGLVEFIEVIQAMGAGAAEEPGVVAGLVDKLKNTPLYPAYEALQDSWKKMLARASSEMEAKPVALPPSPPLTPQTLSTISNKGQQQQQQQQQQRPSDPPSKAFQDQQTETDPLPPMSSAPPTQAPPPTPQTVATDSTKGPKDRLSQPSDTPSKEFKDQQVGTDPLPPASSTPPTQASSLTLQPVSTNSPQDLRRRLQLLTQSPSKVLKDQQIRTDPPPPA
ncbi:hypothetical protein FS837_008603, partial [Tulasnella sp. UAMH 9824]